MAELNYRGRAISSEDILYIREMIAAHPGESRRTLSKKLCEAWQWKQANGALRDMVCRGLLLVLDRAGHIELPPVKFLPRNPLARRARTRPALRGATVFRDYRGRLSLFAVDGAHLGTGVFDCAGHA